MAFLYILQLAKGMHVSSKYSFAEKDHIPRDVSSLERLQEESPVVIELCSRKCPPAVSFLSTCYSLIFLLTAYAIKTESMS